MSLKILILPGVALRKESVDRNNKIKDNRKPPPRSLSARRAWIEIAWIAKRALETICRSPQGERG